MSVLKLGAGVATMGLALGIVPLGAGTRAQAKPGPKVLALSTRSAEARAEVLAAVAKLESFEPQSRINEVAKKAVAADPEFALAHYLVGATTVPAAEGRPHIDKAVALAKNASPTERRYLEAALANRTGKPQEALAALKELAVEVPDERMVFMLLGQVQLGQGLLAEAKVSLEKAMALDASTARVHALLGNVHLLQGEYKRARDFFEAAQTRKAENAAPGAIYYGLAFSHLYEDHPDEALKSLETFLLEYRRTGGFPGLPEVFIFNSMARINLENGRLDEAMTNYEKGFLSVPGSNLPEQDKQVWVGRLHHGRGRTLARMGKHEEAWKEAELIKKMIDDGGEAGKRFVPAYHYLAGYLKLEAGDVAAAVEHLKQSNEADPDAFRKLLLARAYERAGDKEAAKKALLEIVSSKENNLERALAFPEAKRRLARL